MSVLQRFALAVALLVSAALVAYGVSLWSVPAGFVVAGVLLAAVSLLFLLDVGSPPPGRRP